MNTWTRVFLLALIGLLALSACAQQPPATQAPPTEVIAQSTAAPPQDTNTPRPSNTPYPTATITLTKTLRPSSTPIPSKTPWKSPTITPTRTPWPTGLPALKALAAQRGFYIGTSLQAKFLTRETDYAKIAAREFNVMTPEWEMLMCNIWPEPERYDFAFSDQLVQYAYANGMKIRGYALFSGNCVPNWMAGVTYSKAGASELLHNYVLAVVGRYRGLIWTWDVADQTIGKGSVWENMLGADYLKLVFQWAHQADPNALLFYNDTGIEVSNAKYQLVYDTLKGLKDKGVPINGVGMAYHLSYPIPTKMMADAMKQFNDLGLMVQVTQFDMPAQYIANPNAMAQQAQAYGETLQTCLDAANCTAFVMWGFTDKHSWLADTFQNPNIDPLILDKDYQPKPAYAALYKALQTKKK